MNKTMNKKAQSGFTLMEVMVTVSIVSILAALAYPSYTDYVRKGKRSDAKVELLRIAQLQESFFVQNLSYAKKLNGTAAGGGLGFSSSKILTEQKNYEVEIVPPSGCAGTAASPCTTFTLKAVPKGAQIHDTYCNEFTITNTGLKGVSVTGHVDKCWK